MLSEQIKNLIYAEQARQDGLFIAAGIEEYIAKLGERAEIIAHFEAGQCKGFIAYYCNDYATKHAFITLFLVDSGVNGSGLGKALMVMVLGIMKQRQFHRCRLEVVKTNLPALRFYQGCGFVRVGENSNKYRLELNLLDELP